MAPKKYRNEYTIRSDILRRRRVRQMMTQEDLANKAGLSLGQVNRIERGEVTAPHFATIYRLADALGIEGEELIEFQPPHDR